MCSRYCAYVEGAREYLLQSWHPSTRPTLDEPLATGHWLGLKIIRCEAGGADDQTGVVEFIARYRDKGRGMRLHETSRFIRDRDQWHYLDGMPGEPTTALT
jgi:SEC-C motif-containing protein